MRRGQTGGIWPCPAPCSGDSGHPPLPLDQPQGHGGQQQKMEPWPGASPGGTTAPDSRSNRRPERRGSCGGAEGTEGRGIPGAAGLRLPACPAAGLRLPACPAAGTASAALPGRDAAPRPGLRCAGPRPPAIGHAPLGHAPPERGSGARPAGERGRGLGLSGSAVGAGGSAGHFWGY